MMTQAEDILAALGLPRYPGTFEPETQVLCVRTRRPVKIADGRLKGVEITLEGDQFRVWTFQTKKARRLAAEHKLKHREMDHEAEVWVPIAKAKQLLPQFGARPKRSISPEAIQAATVRLAQFKRGRPVQEAA